MLKRPAHMALEFADIALDGLLPRRGAGIALALLLLDPHLLDRLLLECGKRAGQRSDFVLAFGVAGIDRQVARGHLQHAIANGVQRRDHPAADHHHAADRQHEGRGQQRSH